MPTFSLARRSTLAACFALVGFLLAHRLPGGALNPETAPASGLIAPKRTCHDYPANGGKAAMKKAQKSMVCMVNYARRKNGLRSYRGNRQLTWSAKRKANDILGCTFSHSACGRDFTYWMHRSGYLGKGGWTAAENIAWGSGSLGRVRTIFIAWMKSKGHREAILSRDFADVGAGVVKGTFEGIDGARVWVLHFGDN